MQSLRNCIIFFSQLFLQIGNCANLSLSDLPYSEMDIYHPTLEDYYKIQDYLDQERPYLASLSETLAKKDQTRLKREKKRKIISPSQEPCFEIIHPSGTSKQSDQCVITYATVNGYYPLLQGRLVDSLKKHLTNTDILVRLGGWPNIEGGSLKLAHVPQSFKTCFFKEAQALGYKQVLWIDVAYLAIKDLQPIFDEIRRNGYFIRKNFNGARRIHLFNQKVLDYFSIPSSEIHQPLLCHASVIGLDLTNQKALKILDRWYKAAEDLDGFLSPNPDQNAFLLSLYKLNLKPTHNFLDFIFDQKNYQKTQPSACLKDQREEFMRSKGLTAFDING